MPSPSTGQMTGILAWHLQRCLRQLSQQTLSQLIQAAKKKKEIMGGVYKNPKLKVGLSSERFKVGVDI